MSPVFTAKMNLHRKHRPRWPYLTVDQKRKLALTLITSLLLSYPVWKVIEILAN